MPQSLKGFILPVALVLLWEFAARSGFIIAESMSYPSAIARAAWGTILDGSLLQATRETFGAALAGMALGAGLGIACGVAFGLWSLLASLMRLSTEALRPIPSVALIPLALLIYGFGYRMEIAVVAFACFWPLLIITESAVRGIEPRLLEVSRALGFGLLARVFKIVLPAALPRVFVGLRLAAAVSLVVAVTVEITANPIGLGYQLIVAQESMKPDRMFVFLVWIGFLGWLVNAVLLRAQQRWFGRMGNWAEQPR
jgi:ABC-type nitrate/sulfonate/bicarbonate transport system permease component